MYWQSARVSRVPGNLTCTVHSARFRQREPPAVPEGLQCKVDRGSEPGHRRAGEHWRQHAHKARRFRPCGPVSQSCACNTQHGWRAVLVEPVPQNFKGLRRTYQRELASGTDRLTLVQAAVCGDCSASRQEHLVCGREQCDRQLGLKRKRRALPQQQWFFCFELNVKRQAPGSWHPR
eukprot:4065459-Prymnesium_polylepis.1